MNIAEIAEYCESHGIKVLNIQWVRGKHVLQGWDNRNKKLRIAPDVITITCSNEPSDKLKMDICSKVNTREPLKIEWKIAK
jgi:hypothetical protein